MEDAVRAAVEKSEAAAIVLEKHKAALFPHIFVLLGAFGPVNIRSIVAGAVEAAIAAQRQQHATVPPFAEGPK